MSAPQSSYRNSPRTAPGLRPPSEQPQHRSAPANVTPLTPGLFLTVGETAELLHVGEKSILTLAHAGKLGQETWIGKRLMLYRAEVAAFVASGGSKR